MHSSINRKRIQWTLWSFLSILTPIHHLVGDIVSWFTTVLSLVHVLVRTNSVTYNSKCIGDDTKAAARQNLNCIKNKKK